MLQLCSWAIAGVLALALRLTIKGFLGAHTIWKRDPWLHTEFVFAPSVPATPGWRQRRISFRTRNLPACVPMLRKECTLAGSVAKSVKMFSP